METANYHLADAERRLAEIEVAPANSGLVNRRQGVVASVPEDERKQLLTPANTTQSSPDKDLRYDGKTFDEWKVELQTDLSPTLRKEAMLAMAEFAAHGDGKRAAELIFETMQGYSAGRFESSLDTQVKQMAAYGATRVPTAELLSAVRTAMASDNVNLRLFSLRVIPVREANDQVVPLLVAAMQDTNPQVAKTAREHLALVDHDNAAVIASLRQALASGQPAEIEAALLFVRGQPVQGRSGGPWKVAPYLELVPEAVALLDHQDQNIRSSAYAYLRLIGKPLLEPLETILSSGKASDAARKLYEEIEAKNSSPPVDRRR